MNLKLKLKSKSKPIPEAYWRKRRLETR